MIGKADAPGAAFRLFFRKKTELLAGLGDLIIFAVQPVEHEHVEIFHAAARQLLIKEILSVLVFFAQVSGQLFRQQKLISGIAFCHAFFYAQFAVAVQIGITGIEISPAAGQEAVCHLA